MVKNNDGIVVREVTQLGRLLHWRREVIECVFSESPSEELMLANERYYAEAVEKGWHHAVEALCDGREAGCGSICLNMELPSPDNPTGRCAYLMNIYTRPEFRGRGVASAVVKRLVEKGKQLDCRKIYLETTDMGRSVYEAQGFRELPGIMKLEE